MHDVMTAHTERQTLVELFRIVRDAADDEQFNYVPPRGIVRLNFNALAQIVGAKYARITARRCGFQPDSGGMWFRPYARGEGTAVMDVNSIADDLREAVQDLDPLGLLAPFMKGRAEWV